MNWKQILANVAAAAATGFVSTGTWQGAAGAALLVLAGLFQTPPHKQ